MVVLMWDHTSFMFCEIDLVVDNKRKDPMPPNDSGSVSIPAIGLTFTPVAQPEPVVPQLRRLTTFSPGQRVIEFGTNVKAGTVVSLYSAGKDTNHIMFDGEHCVYPDYGISWCLESETEVVAGTRRIKPIPAAPAPLVSYDELKCGEVAVIRRGSCSNDVYIYKGHFNGECMWWYGTVDMAVRVLDRRGDSDGGFGFSGGAKVLRVVGTLRNNPSH